MLVLSRKPGEKIYVGNDITLTVIEIRGNRIRLGIDAPTEVRVLRAELNEFADPAMAGPKEASEAETVF